MQNKVKSYTMYLVNIEKFYKWQRYYAEFIICVSVKCAKFGNLFIISHGFILFGADCLWKYVL